MQGERIYFSDQNLLNGQDQLNGNGVSNDHLVDVENKFMHFIQETVDNGTYIYREQLKNNSLRGNYFIAIDFIRLANFDDVLAKEFKAVPDLYLPVFEKAVEEIYRNNIYDPMDENMESSPKFQVQVQSDEVPLMIRDLQSNLIGQLVCVPGIITSTSKSQIRATKAVFKCSNCGHEKSIQVKFGFKGATPPNTCDNAKLNGDQKQKCGYDTYQFLQEKSEFADQQNLKLQEAPELIPTGEMPRSLVLTVDRYLTDKCTPGNRIKVIGILSIINSKNTTSTAKSQNHIQKSYIKVIGLVSNNNIDSSSGSFMGFAMPNITDEDQEVFEQMRRDPNIYEKISSSIAPSILGHSDIKKTIACLLFGGCAKKLPDGMRLRGDINVLLLGDPSVAKSQFLKFVDRVAPISVYTSGKGSSAAGLTASVIRDPSSGDFSLEGGAMVLADGGVVCIDEFDKMRPQDRVAIHEAMEQQTISIAKAGITTILNSRTSVLAAANPLFGRYDDLKHAAEQIDFQSSILSRFDSIFIVRDIREDGLDKAIAQHVVSLHMHAAQQDERVGEISLELLRKYVCYAKTKLQPKLSEEACHMLQNLYVTDRQASKDQRVSKKTNGIPITVRQLEAIIRISEAIAKIHLEPNVLARHVDEAHRLFKISTLNAAQSGMSSSSQQTPQELTELVKKIEEAIKRRVAIGVKIPYVKIQQEMLMRFDNQRAIDYAIVAMIRKGDLTHLENRKLLCRQIGQFA